MTASIKHRFQSTKPDSTLDGMLEPSHWNAEHDLSGVVLSVNNSLPDTGGNVIISALTTSDIGVTVQGYNSNLGEIALLTSTQMQSLTTTGVAGLTTTQIATMAAHPTATGNVHSLTASEIGALTTTAIGVTVEAYSTNLGQIAALTTTQILSLTSQGIAALSTSQISSLSTVDARFEGKKDKHGWATHPPIKTELSIAKPSTNWIFTLSAGVGGTFEYYYQGTEVIITGNKTYDFGANPTANTVLHFLYFDDTTGTIKHSTDAWNLYTLVPIATCFFNGTTWAITEERHYAIRDRSWHIWSHLTIGSRLSAASDFAMTAPAIGVNTTVNIAGGTLFDEDLEHTPSTSTAVRLWYKTSASAWTFVDPATTPYDGTVKYTNASWQQVDVSAAKYINQWYYATPDINKTIYAIREIVAQDYNSIANARAVSPPNLSTIGFLGNAEVKLLYRIIWKGDDTVQEVTDYRASSPIAGGGAGAVSAAAVSYTPTAPDVYVTVQGALDNRQLLSSNLTSLAALNTVQILSLTTQGIASLTTTQIQGLTSAGGISNVVSATTATTLSSTKTLLTITPAGYGVAVTLPDATTCTISNPYHIVSNKGAFPIRILNSARTLLGFVNGNTVSHISLENNSTSAGVWDVGNSERVGCSAKLSFFPTSSVIQKVIRLDSTRELILSGNIYGVVYNNDTNTFGTEVQCRSGGAQLTALKIATDTVLLVSSSGTAFEAVILSISGTAITVNTAATATLSANISTFADGCGIEQVGSSYVISYTVATPAAQLRAITVSGTTPTIGSATVLDGTAGGLMVVTGDKVIAVSTATTHLYTRPYTISGSTISAGTGTDTASGTMTLNKLTALGSTWAVLYNDGGSTPKGGIISLSSTTTTITTVTLLTAGTIYDAIVVGGKVLVSGTNTGSEFNLLSDNAGTATAGTVRNFGTVASIPCICASGTDAYVQEGTTTYIVHKLDCSGTSIVTPSTPIAQLQLSNAEMPVYPVSNSMFLRGANAIYGTNYGRTIITTATTQNFGSETFGGVWRKAIPARLCEFVNTAYRGATEQERWVTEGNFAAKVECVP